MTTATDDYILVRDKDGNLKYFKDGQYFDVDAINQPAALPPVKPAATIVMTPRPIDMQEGATGGTTAARSELNEKMIQTIDAIVQKLKFRFSDEATKKRFYGLIDTRLRGIRSDKEVAYMMTTPKDQGGMGLPAEHLDTVMTVIRNFAEAYAKDQKDAASKSLQAPVSPPIVDSPSMPPARPVVPTTATAQAAPQKQPYKPIIPLPEDGYDLATSLKQQGLTPTHTEVKPIRKTLEPAPTKKMMDMSYRPALTGPLDELRYMDVQNFHRLGSTPAQMADEIAEKIAVLQEENFPQRFAAIKAWRESPVHLLYLDMGTQSITEGKPVSEIIVARQVSNTPTLTKSEFDAIASLNMALQM